VTVEKGPAVARVEVPKLTPAPVAAIETPEVKASLDTTPPRGAPLPPAQVPESAPRGLSTQQIVGIALGGAGIVLLAVGAGYGVRAIKKNNAAKDEGCKGDTCTSSDLRGERLTDDGLKASTIANVGWSVGAALIAGGLVTYFLAPKRETKLALSVDRQSAAIGVGGVF
jgi:hypothetical protein